MRNAPRFGRSLSGRLLRLTIAAVLITAVLIFIPDLARERRAWLNARVTEAHMMVLALSGLHPEQSSRLVETGLLQLARVAAIRVQEPGHPPIVIGPDALPYPETQIDLRQESVFGGMGAALREFLLATNRLVLVRSGSPFRPGTEVQVFVEENHLRRALQRFAIQFWIASMVLACVTGALVYVALNWLLVRPMRRIIGSIAAFRANPDATPPLDPNQATVLSDDEMAIATRELAAMQQELHAALWRHARLAALGAVMAKMSHDLRGILAPAMLTADALKLNQDPSVRRAGDVLVRAVERATDLVRRSLEYVREGPSRPARTRFSLTELVDEACESLRELPLECQVENSIPATLTVEADREELLRVLVNLGRNAAEAGAHNLRIHAAQQGGSIEITVADDGPGIPDSVRPTLFRPFSASTKRGGSGLGLAIARDLMRAQGGDVDLVSSGGTGTVFRLTLPSVRQDVPAAV